MPAPQSRPIKKPRISLSCIVCRRRKVRCGREQPECANCVRMKETCVYRAMARDESTGRVRPASPSPQNCHCGGSDPHHLPHPNPHSQSQPGVSRTRRDGRTACSADQHQHQHQPSLSRPASHSNRFSDPRTTPLCRDYLSLRRGAHVRYIGPTFWGSISGKVSCALQEELFRAIIYS